MNDIDPALDRTPSTSGATRIELRNRPGATGIPKSRRSSLRPRTLLLGVVAALIALSAFSYSRSVQALGQRCIAAESQICRMKEDASRILALRRTSKRSCGSCGSMKTTSNCSTGFGWANSCPRLPTCWTATRRPPRRRVTMRAATRRSNTLRSDPSWWVRYAAVLALGRTKKGFVIGALEECLRLEPKWQIRMSAVRSLQDVGGPRAAEAISLALRDKDSGVRTAAALALGEMGSDAQIEALSAALKAETDLSARSTMSAAFRRILSKP